MLLKFYQKAYKNIFATYDYFYLAKNHFQVEKVVFCVFLEKDLSLYKKALAALKW